MKHLLSYLTTITLVTLLAGCAVENDITKPGYKGDVIVRFDASGISENDESEIITRSNTEENIVEENTIQLGNDLFMTTTLKEVAGSNTRANVSLNANATYRVIAYDASTGAYADHADYTLGDTSPFLDLATGTTYNLVAYSYNSSATLPSEDKTTPYSSVNLPNVPAGTDLIY